MLLTRVGKQSGTAISSSRATRAKHPPQLGRSTLHNFQMLQVSFLGKSTSDSDAAYNRQKCSKGEAKWQRGIACSSSNRNHKSGPISSKQQQQAKPQSFRKRPRHRSGCSVEAAASLGMVLWSKQSLSLLLLQCAHLLLS